MEIRKIPNKENLLCVVMDSESRFAEVLRSDIKGSFQEEFVNTLLEQGYDRPTADIKGKAANYRGRYDRSIANLVNRINTKLNKLAAPYSIKSGRVGPKGGFGYYIN